MASPDPEEWSFNDWVDREFIDYELQPHERLALDTITKNIKEQAYDDPRNCFQHMQFLETLANKLKEIIGNERSIGKANWDVERAYNDVKGLYQQLGDVHRRLRR